MRTSRLEHFPEFRDFVEFLEQRSQALSMIASETKAHKGSAIDSRSPLKLAKQAKRAFHFSTGSKKQNTYIADRKCPLCSQNHYIGACTTFLAKSRYGRRDDVCGLSLCFNCMGPHKSQRCTSKRRCKECRDKHYSSLHTTVPRQAAAILKSEKSTFDKSSEMQPAPSSTVSILPSSSPAP